MPAVIQSNTMVIQSLLFDRANKIGIQLNDGRELYVPLRAYPELQSLSLEQLKKYSIINQRTILFEHADSIYHLEDFFGLEELWRMR